MNAPKKLIPTPAPTALNVRTQSRVLEINFDDGKEFSLPFELLRVYSPSAEVRGHGIGQETLQTGKREIAMTGLEPVGNYAVKPLFSDGHESGIFSWDYLYWLGDNQGSLWLDYMERLHAAGHPEDSGRDFTAQIKSGGSCGSKH
ncbi:gamma-butyrobetaine hydroxylase-like domain-containing protein [Undibacterium parvum]|uniref:DUF971 domain-containing protein n=1 Tax=Undibacterium parvum TaxID=401471 RepID=A0A3S9HKW6_9BURK|nr:DUF971 domain-containing protein [Undibacterium parvum]AZP12757.1 DUF971 domain-containing protein [Undibacterium parvum]